MRSEFVTLGLFFTTLLQAQDSVKHQSALRVKFASIHQLGFVVGASAAEPIIQSVNGIQVGTWFAGIGVGLDYYKERSVPLFLDVRRNIFAKPQTPFVYAAGGKHIAWRSSPPKEWISSGLEGGWYYDLGAGYKSSISKKQQMVVSVGYSVKYMSEDVNTMPWISAFPPPPGAKQKREYTLSRISFKIGLGL